MATNTTLISACQVRSRYVDLEKLRPVLGDEQAEQVARLQAAPPKPRKGAKPTGGQRRLLDPGGEPWVDGNRAMRSIDGKESSQAATATKLTRYRQWCHVNGVPPRHATVDDLLDYREYRLDEDEVEASTWNGDVAALSTLYRNLLARQKITTLPWSGSRSLRASESAMQIRSITTPMYQQFRDVGIAGYALDGSLDSGFTSITPMRNSLYCNLLVTTGLRRIEGSYLTLFDLPELEQGQFFNESLLPGPICKREKVRPWQVSRVWLDSLGLYHRSEWHDTVANAQKALRNMGKAGTLNIVIDYDGERVRFDHEPKEWRRIKSLKRWRRAVLVMTPGVASTIGLGELPSDWLIPAAVFPGTRKPSVSPDAWSLVFRNANLRLNALLRQAGQPQVKRVTPHMLRHTFALNYLRGRMEAMQNQSPPDLKKAQFATLSKFFMNPLVDLKNLLGHESMDTTLLYLREISRHDPMHQKAHHSWVEAFMAEGE